MHRVARVKCLFVCKTGYTISGDHGGEDPPDLIPNSEVKLPSADGTWWETARESRTSPESFYEAPVWKQTGASFVFALFSFGLCAGLNRRCSQTVAAEFIAAMERRMLRLANDCSNSRPSLAAALWLIRFGGLARVRQRSATLQRPARRRFICQGSGG